MTNKEIIKLLPKLKEMKEAEKRLGKKINEIFTKREKLNEKIYVLEQVTEIYEGIPLHCWSSNKTDFYLRSFTSRGECRSAEVYLNQHNRKTWGLRISSNEFSLGTEFCGYDWKKKEAIEAAKQWVCFRTVPKGVQL